ncbi:MAG: AAA family ATPase [bacterium]
MRILNLDLIAYGRFTNTSLDLSSGKEGLHIIYGPNEAGKSTALRALTNFFYGIPLQTDDNFLHKNKKLQIGVCLTNSNNNETYFLRRKGRKDTLLDKEGNPLPDSTLNRYLNSISREAFLSMFGIDHRQLVEGGRELVIGGGKVGENLFSVGMGIPGLRDILKGLRHEADELFKPTARNLVLNKLISEFKEIREKINGAMLSSKEWETHDKALKELVMKCDKINHELLQLHKRQLYQKRLKEALPIILEREERYKQLEAMKGVILLPSSFPEQRRETKRILDEAILFENKTKRELKEIEETIKSLYIQDTLVKQGASITELYKRLGNYLTLWSGLPKLQNEWECLQANARFILQELHPEARLEEADTFRLGIQRQIRIMEFGNELQLVEEEYKRVIKTIQELDIELNLAREWLAKLEIPRDYIGLKASLARAQRKIDLEEGLEIGERRLKEEERQFEADLAGLTLWSGGIEGLERLPIPSLQTIDSFSSRFEGIVSRIREVDIQIRGGDNELRGLNNQIETLRLSGSVPTEEELIEARNRRDQGWQLILKNWIEKEDISEKIIGFNKELPLDKAYEEQVKRTDEIVDRLRREADRVAFLAKLLSSESQTKGVLKELQDLHANILNERALVEREWDNLWDTIGIKGQSPKEMIAWSKKREALINKTRRLREERGKIEQARQVIQGHCKEIHNCLSVLGEKKEDFSLAQLVEHSQILINKAEAINKSRKDIERGIIELEKNHLKATKNREEIAVRLRESKTTWTEAVKEIGLNPNTSPAQVNTIITKTQEMFKKVDESRERRQRIELMQHETTRFDVEVKRLIEEVAPDLITKSINQAVIELNDRLNKTTKDMVRLEGLRKEQGKKERILYETQEGIKDRTLRLQEMFKQASCLSYEELENIENQSLKKQAIQEEIRQLEIRLQHLASYGGLTIEELTRETAKYNLDTLSLELEGIEKEIVEKGNYQSELNQTIGSERRELEKMDGRAIAAEAAEEAQWIISNIREKAEHYIRLCTASLILNLEIERYRQKNQGPILKRASYLFSELTLGSFTSLKIAYDDNDHHIFLGVRPSGEEVLVGGMSDGTCDQLYLALRLASLERRLEESEAMPFIIDDILINFDNERAKASLKVLGELSNKMQVIFFTHHAHIVELAKEVVASEMLQVHYL